MFLKKIRAKTNCVMAIVNLFGDGNCPCNTGTRHYFAMHFPYVTHVYLFEMIIFLSICLYIMLTNHVVKMKCGFICCEDDRDSCTIVIQSAQKCVHPSQYYPLALSSTFLTYLHLYRVNYATHQFTNVRTPSLVLFVLEGISIGQMPRIVSLCYCYLAWLDNLQ